MSQYCSKGTCGRNKADFSPDLRIIPSLPKINSSREDISLIGERIDTAVITVPAYFTHKEREATIEAGRKAGIEVLAIINEPAAAAFGYGLNNKTDEQTVLIYDLGGGTFDVTIANKSKQD